MADSCAPLRGGNSSDKECSVHYAGFHVLIDAIPFYFLVCDPLLDYPVETTYPLEIKNR